MYRDLEGEENVQLQYEIQEKSGINDMCFVEVQQSDWLMDCSRMFKLLMQEMIRKFIS